MSLKSRIKQKIQNYKEKKGYSFNTFTIEEMLNPEFFAYNYYQYGNWHDKLEFSYKAAIFQQLLALSGIKMRYGVERTNEHDLDEDEYITSLSLYLQREKMYSASENQLASQTGYDTDIERMLNFKLTRQELEQSLLRPDTAENRSYNERIIAFAKRYEQVQTEILSNNYQQRFQAEIDRLDKTEDPIVYTQDRHGKWKEVNAKRQRGRK